MKDKADFEMAIENEILSQNDKVSGYLWGIMPLFYLCSAIVMSIIGWINWETET
jgi:hypothetical protein